MTDTTKQNPSNIKAEQILIGSIIINNTILDKVTEFLLPEHFYEMLHAQIYSLIIKLANKQISPSLEVLETSLKDNGHFKELGEGSYLAMLTRLALIEINPFSYANLIYELAIRRNLISLAQKIASNAYNTDITYSADEQIQEAETELFNLSFAKSGDKSFFNLATSLKQSMASIQMAAENPSHINGITTGLTDLDKMFAGFQPSDLIIIAARPSMGKTALAINLALNAAKTKALKDTKRCYSVGFFSLEMSSEQLSTRILSMEVETNSTQLKTGFIDERKYNQLRIKSEELAELNLFIDDTPALTISSIRTRARRLKKQKNLDILFIDYLQLIRSPSASDNRVQEVSEITQGLKALAKELNLPIIALSQLSRAVEQRVDKRPMLSDLRESGSIEQDADIVMFIYREEYYLTRSKAVTPKDVMLEHEKLERVRNIANVIVAKHRNGPIGDVILHYNNNLGKFSNYTNA